MSDLTPQQKSELQLLNDNLMRDRQRLRHALEMLILATDFDPFREMDGVYSALQRAKTVLRQTEIINP